MSNKYIFSATEIDTFLTCKRKWANRYLLDIKSPSTKAQEFGKLVHETLFNYLLNQNIENTLAGQVAKPGLVFLPQKLPKENLEHYFSYAKDGHIFHGYIDFYEELDQQRIVIGDHKTCSNFKRAMTPEQLKNNIQANLYAQWAFTQKGAKSVLLRWIYYRTNSKPKALCVEAELTKEVAEENFKPIKAAVNEIKQILATKSPNNQPQNRAACFMFGKCDFFEQCKTQEILDMPKAKTKHAFHLYLDCVPIKNNLYTETIELSQLLKPVLSKLNEKENLTHYRLAGFGKHSGLIAKYLQDYLEKKNFDCTTAIFSSSRTPEGADTLATLSGAAALVVRGL